MLVGIGTRAFLQALSQHLQLTVVSVLVATAIGVPLGIHLARERFLAGPMLAVMSAIQTVPSVALLGFLIPLIGIGAKPAVLTLSLYALLPITRNTYTGITQVAPAAIEAARGIGMREWQIVWHVTLPQSLPVLIAGIRTSAVLSVGIATICALVGAGGLGTFIFRGISILNAPMILVGAVPIALLALMLDGMLAVLERWIVPRGLRERR